MQAFCTDRQRPLVLVAAVLASSMGFIDGTVVSIAIPAIRASLGASLDQAAWINNAYMVTLSALILTGGAFGDRFGLAKIFSLGVTLFLLTSLACALAPTPDLLIVARLAQGAGAALMIPGALAMISRAYPPEIRGRAIGIWAAASGLTTAAGPIVGGLLLSSGDAEAWRWIFGINLPLGLIALVMIRRAVSHDTRRHGDPIDVVGALLGVTGLGLLAWMLTHLEAASNDLRITLATGVGGVVVLTLFLLHEWRTPHAMMPLRLFASATFSAANLATFLLYFGMSAILFFLPMLTVAGWGMSEFQTIFAFAPLSGFIALLSTRFGRLADRRGSGPVVAVGAAVVTLGYVVLALVVGSSQNFWLGVLPAMSIVGFGMSMVVAPLSTAVMVAAGDGQAGIASGVNNAISRIGGLIAVAAMSSLATIAYTRAGGTATFGERAAGTAHVLAMGDAFALVAWVAAGLAAVAAIAAALGIRRP
ncbi:MFS transporter [Loktanella fryxellensis]|uniref:MFS transporter n=1 Tax=Loktanella fryxellensis TaxID=245187 RepID=UPI001FE027A5|nr:MFS transporter [Loktanella fryxellensis]